MVKRFLPLIVLLVIVAIAAWRLAVPGEERVRSQLVGQPVPEFALEPMFEDRPGLSSASLEGPRMVNLFGSWCIPCIAEAPLLDALAARGVTIDAIAVRDTPGAVRDFLDRHGDPFAAIGTDPDSAAMIAFGASGVPESFIVDRNGVITYHHQGPIMPADVEVILAEWEAVQ
ncbi:redoxin family protein [Sphingomicrobium clamense]|uniref:Redoxin family protein n=1 Tax=Sphingomicrobium clamense TaxID=2851013 RepID=A0ABS6V854_9SPHN|nr:redoxin family protein [Sphingomicrobium sp. B8]MBW0145238.1 redoxin family protein [Sphingomicrobium sp. B8]